MAQEEDIACIESIAKIVSDLNLESVDYNKDGLHIIVTNRAKEIVKALTLLLEGKTDEADVDIPARSSDKRLRVVRIISLIAAVLVVIGAVVPSLINILFG